MRDYVDGIDASSGFLSTTAPVLVRSLRETTQRGNQSLWRFRTDEDVPAALVPIMRGGRRIGVIAVYGQERGVPVVTADRTFLLSLAATVGNSIEQWETFLRALALDELDALFGCRTMDELLTNADRLFRRYLAARGCMIVF